MTLERPDLVRPLTIVNKPRKAPVVLSEEEVARLLEAAPSLKYKAALSVAYGAGLRVSEVANLKVPDIDSQRMTLRVEQGKPRVEEAHLERPNARGLVLGRGLSPARRFTSLSLHHGPNLGAEGVESEGFREHVHASVKKIAPECGVLGISGNEEYLQIRSRAAGDFRQLPAVDMR